MPKIEITHKDMKSGLKLMTGDVHVLALRRALVEIIEMDDLNFHIGSAVVLPISIRNGEWEEGYIGGLDCIARGLTYSQESGHALMVIGHTDSTGGRDANLALSELRAQSAYRLLTGERDAWAQACHEAYKVEDYQLILKWIRDEFGWNCHPGAIDDVDGPNTRGALGRFRDQYDASFETSLPRDSQSPTLDDWSAFFDLYEAALAEVADVSSLRGGLRFTEPSILACGESWPIVGQGRDDFRSSTNRRVELVFFDEAPPDLSESDPPGTMLYGSNLYYHKVYISVDPSHCFYFSV